MTNGVILFLSATALAIIAGVVGQETFGAVIFICGILGASFCK